MCVPFNSFQSLAHFYGENVLLNSNKYLGGIACKDQINGPCSSDKTKGAYPDISLVWKDRYAFVEIDENRHNNYDKSCELARYETVHYGTETTKPSRFFRFNPHSNDNTNYTILDKIKVLIQSLRNYFNIDLNPDVVFVPSLVYFYYGEV